MVRFATINAPIQSPVAKTDADIKLMKIKKTENLLNSEIADISQNIEE